EKILEDFDHQMDGSESIPPLVIRLKPDAEFTAKSARRIPRARRAFVEKEVKDLLEKKVIVKSEAPCYSPIVIVPKRGTNCAYVLIIEILTQ
ncbi:hypothetical protein ADUPG1_003300, partial [Aduncisulcus paluster]